MGQPRAAFARYAQAAGRGGMRLAAGESALGPLERRAAAPRVAWIGKCSARCVFLRRGGCVAVGRRFARARAGRCRRRSALRSAVFAWARLPGRTAQGEFMRRCPAARACHARGWTNVHLRFLRRAGRKRLRPVGRGLGNAGEPRKRGDRPDSKRKGAILASGVRAGFAGAGLRSWPAGGVNALPVHPCPRYSKRPVRLDGALEGHS